MKKYYKTLNIIVTFLLIIKPSFADYRISNALANRVERLERDLTILQKEYYRAENQNSVHLDNDLSLITNQNTAAVESKFEYFEEKFRNLQGELEKLDNLINIINQKFQKATIDYEQRLEDLENQQTNIIPKVKQDQSSNQAKNSNKQISPNSEVLISPPDSPQNQFDKAFLLIKANKFTEAESAFESFIKNNPTSKLLTSSYFWLAESYLGREIYDKAALNFLKGYKKSPKANKAPECLLKLAISLNHLKKNKEACATLSQLLNEYPKLSAVIKERAKIEHKKLNCK